MVTPEFGPFWEKKARSFFKKMNQNKDDRLSRNDFELLADRYIQAGRLDGVQAKQARRKIVMIWDDFLGKATKPITEVEFFESLRSHGKEFIIKYAVQAFGLWFDAGDVSGDGLIQQQEYVLLLKILGVEDEDAAVESFKTIDVNGNGTLSYEEFVSAGVEYFLTEDESKPSKHILGPIIE